VWYTQSQRCLDALVDPRSGSVAACNPADQQKEKGCAISVLDYKDRCVLEPPAARCKDFHNCSACANASAAGCMWFTEGAAGGSGACVEANESTPGVWETCNAEDAPLTHGCNRTVQTYRTRCPLDAAKPFCANYTRACDCMAATGGGGDGGCVWCEDARACVAAEPAAPAAGGGWALCNSVDQKKCALSAQGCVVTPSAPDFCAADDRCGDAPSAQACADKNAHAAGPSSPAVVHVLGKKGASCDEACAPQGLVCEAPQLNATAMLATFASLGAQCTTKVGARTHDWEPAYVPISASSGRCTGYNSTATAAAAPPSACDATQPGARRLCRCVSECGWAGAAGACINGGHKSCQGLLLPPPLPPPPPRPHPTSRSCGRHA